MKLNLKSRGNNSESMKAGVVIFFVHDTSSLPVLHYDYEVSSKYS